MFVTKSTEVSTSMVCAFAEKVEKIKEEEKNMIKIIILFFDKPKLVSKLLWALFKTEIHSMTLKHTSLESWMNT